MSSYILQPLEKISAQPIVKWAGGKRQLLSELKSRLPQNFNRYFEPFIGGGALFFDQSPKNAYISDINKELINTYKVIQNNVYELITQLKGIQSQYISLDVEGRKRYFLEKRKLYNSKRCSSVEVASLFIFLNRTCFNGLYRVNSKGEFNVPHGRYANPKICDADNLLAVSKLMQRVEILCGDFAETEKFAGENTIYYLDPPYKPLSETSSFTSYAKDGFGDAEQIRLRDFCTRIAEKKAIFVASNSDPKEETGESFFEHIYCQFKIKRVSATRLINANPNNRGLVSEIMISNIANTLI